MSELATKAEENVQKSSVEAEEKSTKSTTNTTKSTTVKLDDLGPIVINTNGTLARIPNWHELTDAEQKNTVRLIAKRNKERMAALARGQTAQAAFDDMDFEGANAKKKEEEEQGPLVEITWIEAPPEPAP